MFRIALGNASQNSRLDQPHEPGETDQRDVPLAQLADQRPVVRLARGEGGVSQHQRLDARRPRALQSPRLRPIRNHHDDGAAKVAVALRVDQRLQIAAAARDEHADGGRGPDECMRVHPVT